MVYYEFDALHGIFLECNFCENYLGLHGLYLMLIILKYFVELFLYPSIAKS